MTELIGRWLEGTIYKKRNLTGEVRCHVNMHEAVGSGGGGGPRPQVHVLDVVGPSGQYERRGWLSEPPEEGIPWGEKEGGCSRKRAS